MKTLLIASTSALTLAAAPAVAQEIPADQPQKGPQAIKYLNQRELARIDMPMESQTAATYTTTSDVKAEKSDMDRKAKMAKADDMKVKKTSADKTSADWSQASEANILKVASTTEDFSILTKLVKEAGLTDELAGPGPMTVFAPTDAAFKALGAEKIKELKADPVKLERVLKAHIVDDTIMLTDISADPVEFDTVGDTVLTLERDDMGQMTASNMAVSRGDIVTSNGVIHVLDSVIIPEYDENSVIPNVVGR
ncbi:MAG: hypothetical protein CMK07_15725 [Ponticaulis sp.]|nr:hypothetical protein [Ponticaulis sp.]